ncbi:PcfJ domain-containing protein [Morganella morganii]
MHHCVYSYAHDCANETYRVFTIINNDERATLGISQVENHKIFKFDQVMGVSNSAVSSEIIKMSKKVLNQVNSKINKVNLINLGE